MEVLQSLSVSEIDNENLSPTLLAGCFRKLSDITLEFCGPLTLHTAALLILWCDSLGVMENLNAWSNVSDVVKRELFNTVKTNNLELTVGLG
jgi:hypothetical protein